MNLWLNICSYGQTNTKVFTDLYIKMDEERSKYGAVLKFCQFLTRDIYIYMYVCIFM